MALAAVVADVVFRSAQAIGRAARSIDAWYSVARSLQRAYGYLEGANFSTFQAIARRAVSGVLAARQMNRAPTRQLTARDIPIDPTIRANDPRYRYRVLVTVSRDGSDPVSYAVDIESDTPMSQRQIRDEVSEHTDDHQSARRSTQRAVAAIQEGSTVNVTILAAGKRG